MKSFHSLVADVIRELDRYRCSRVPRGRHPLWLAVVELEKRSRPMPLARKQNRLYQPAFYYWIKGLHAARAGLYWEAKGHWSVLRQELLRYFDDDYLRQLRADFHDEAMRRIERLQREVAV